MKRNSTRISGRKPSTVPRPPNSPSLTRLCSGPAGIHAATCPPSQPKPSPIASVIGLPSEYTAWNTRNITTARIARPNTGCRVQRSSASSISAVTRGIVTVAASSSRTWACRSARLAASLGRRGAAAGTSPSTCSISACAPPRFTATVSTTGRPSRRCSSDTSMTMPRERAVSIMFSASTTGRPRRWTSSTKRRCRRRLVASATQTIRSGTASPG